MVKAKTGFIKKLDEHNIKISRKNIDVLQVNVGKLCNQACNHCHVEAGPKRTEIMELKTIDRILELLKKSPEIKTVDLTGGAPEMNPHFKYFVESIRSLGIDIIDRCNLTVLFEKGQENTAKFLKNNKVQVVASLPCYSKGNVDKQRGKGVFDKSIKALKILNEFGYGKDNSGLVLNLVYNPGGAFLPPNQAGLEADYKKQLKEDLDIEFNNLFTITNMPIKRFAHYLQREGKLEEYMQLLLDNFNPDAAKSVMCNNQLSIGWNGEIYDCDFNQMLEIPANWNGRNIWDINSFEDLRGDIALDDHCYGCTAGSGSSCGGALS